MLGFIFKEIEEYVKSNLGVGAWTQILTDAGLGDRKKFLNGLYYPDEELISIVVSTASVSGSPVAHVLKEFGRFLGGHLFTAYKPLIHPDWRTLEFLENVEETIHGVVRARNKKATPPQLICHRVASREVLVNYRSERKLCQLAQGMILGVAGHYGERIQLLEETCMHRNDESCKIWVALGRRADELTEDEESTQELLYRRSNA